LFQDLIRIRKRSGGIISKQNNNIKANFRNDYWFPLNPGSRIFSSTSPISVTQINVDSEKMGWSWRTNYRVSENKTKQTAERMCNGFITGIRNRVHSVDGIKLAAESTFDNLIDE
jgi:hypothetical protein